MPESGTAPTPLALVQTRRFAPLLAGYSIGAFADNLFRSALILLIQYGIYDGLVRDAIATGQTADYIAALRKEGVLLATLAPGVFMLPYFLFSATAGQLADKLDKAWWMKRLKFVEFIVMLIAALALNSGSVLFMMGSLFVAGTIAAFYSTVKYSILPQLLHPRELLTGNALVSAATNLTILLGTMVGGGLVVTTYGPEMVAAMMVSLSFCGWLASLYILPAPSITKDLRINPNIFGETFNILRQACAKPGIPLIIAGNAWFWFVSSLYVTLMPSLTKEVVNATESVFLLFFGLFSVGIALGAMTARRLLGATIDGRYTVLGALGLAVCGAALAISLQTFPPHDQMLTLSEFVRMRAGWFVMAELLLLTLCAGIYFVPLSAMLQSRANPELRARTIAAANIIDSAAMVAASVFAFLLIEIGFSIPMIWLLVALGNLIAIPVIIALIPQMTLKSIFQRVLRACFDVKVTGLENLEKAGPRAVIVANHVSLLDGLLLAAFLPGKPLFAVDTHIAQKWWVKPFLALIEAYRIDPTRPMALKGLINRVTEGAHCVIFPEGRITTTGALMKVNEGPGLIAEKAGALIVPVRIEGAEYTRLSYLKGMVRRRTFPRVRLTILPPEKFELPTGISARARRQLAAQKLYDLMSNLIFETSMVDESLIEALLDARATHGGRRPVLEDFQRQPVGYNRIITGMIVLGRRFSRLGGRGERIGLMLPNSNAAAISFLALNFTGRTPAMINFSSGAASILACCEAATLKHIITSRKFIEQARLEPLAAALAQKVTLVYLEDIKAGLTLADKLAGFFGQRFARYLHRRYNVKAEDAAVVLFTSGSEGTPKGVVLSHRNLLANRWQVGARIAFSPKDIVLNALPLFHSFGLTGGLLVPLLAGARTMLYPSPLHYRIIPLLAYDCNATILFGTDTFLTGYARTAHPYDFYSLRFICAGAEKVREETRRLYAERYGVRILEGYGATETAPAITINTLMHSKAGTVGRLLPGMKAKITPVPGITEGGRLHVTGPNIMMGYLKTDNPGVLQPPTREDDENWHDTGDIVSIDETGYVKILGRAKRFAKIAGEMISLGAVEALVERCWPGAAHAVVAIPDARKGEALVLCTTKPEAETSELLALLKQESQSELMLPRQMLHFETLPLLGSGKTDYVELQRLVGERLQKAA